MSQPSKEQTPVGAPPPAHGYTLLGVAVHGHVHDHMRTDTAYARFNKRVALTITKYVGSMTCFWVFCFLSLCSLPSVLSGFEVFHGAFPAWMVKVSIIALVAWIAQTFLQLVLLPSIMVGQNLQNEAADARSAKTFEDVEVVLDRLDCSTQGGLTEVLEAIEALKTSLR
jgi:hypothetical protein